MYKIYIYIYKFHTVLNHDVCISRCLCKIFEAGPKWLAGLGPMNVLFSRPISETFMAVGPIAEQLAFILNPGGWERKRKSRTADQRTEESSSCRYSYRILIISFNYKCINIYLWVYVGDVSVAEGLICIKVLSVIVRTKLWVLNLLRRISNICIFLDYPYVRYLVFIDGSTLFVQCAEFEMSFVCFF